jgi:hypothetical protein
MPSKMKFNTSKKCWIIWLRDEVEKEVKRQNSKPIKTFRFSLLNFDLTKITRQCENVPP